MVTLNKLSIFSAVFCVVAASCEDRYTICDQPRVVNYQAGFYNKSGSLDVPAVPASLTLTFPGVTTFIYNQQPGIASLVLALNPAADSVRYFIQVNGQPADTITFRYTNAQQTLSPECGDITVHSFTQVRTTTNTLDSVKIVAPAVNNVLRENLRIYY